MKAPMREDRVSSARLRESKVNPDEGTVGQVVGEMANGHLEPKALDWQALTALKSGAPPGGEKPVASCARRWVK